MYKQGDIILALFPFSDLSGSKMRPALILSSNRLNSAGDYVCVQITSKIFTDDCFFILSDKKVSVPLKLTSGLRLQKIFTVNSSIVQQKISEVTPNAFIEIVAAINNHVIGN